MKSYDGVAGGSLQLWSCKKLIRGFAVDEKSNYLCKLSVPLIPAMEPSQLLVQAVKGLQFAVVPAETSRIGAVTSTSNRGILAGHATTKVCAEIQPARPAHDQGVLRHDGRRTGRRHSQVEACRSGKEIECGGEGPCGQTGAAPLVDASHAPR